MLNLDNGEKPPAANRAAVGLRPHERGRLPFCVLSSAPGSRSAALAACISAARERSGWRPTAADCLSLALSPSLPALTGASYHHSSYHRPSYRRSSYRLPASCRSARFLSAASARPAPVPVPAVACARASCQPDLLSPVSGRHSVVFRRHCQHAHPTVQYTRRLHNAHESPTITTSLSTETDVYLPRLMPENLLMLEFRKAFYTFLRSHLWQKLTYA